MSLSFIYNVSMCQNLLPFLKDFFLMWTVFKVFIGIFTILLLLCFLKSYYYYYFCQNLSHVGS